MFSRLRKRLTYTNVAMTLALVFAMTGGAYAASKFVITSTKQIKPSVLKQLQGKAGKAGAAGANGANGAQGPQGAAGTPGKDGTNGTNGTNGKDGAPGTPGTNGKDGLTGFTATLPKGSTEKGAYGAIGMPAHFGLGTFEGLYSPISFDIPLATAPEAHTIGLGEGEKEAKESPFITAGECTGTVANPGAAEGKLCIFIQQSHNLKVLPSGVEGVLSDDPSSGALGGAGSMGSLLWVVAANNAEYVQAFGTWAVTAE